MAEKIKFKICGPHHVGFYTIGEAKLSEHCCTSFLPPLYLFSILPSYITALGGLEAGGGRGVVRGDVVLTLVVNEISPVCSDVGEVFRPSLQLYV